jgi:hypothetical protein
MSKIMTLLEQKRYEELWNLCCGFIDLTTDQFMNVQKQLLLEQIQVLNRCILGRKIMHRMMPTTIEEFRQQVPMTTYADYCPELLEKNESVLPSKPIRWIQTSGRSGEYPCKWIPVSQKFWDEAGLNFCAVAIFGSCNHKYDIAFKKGFKLLHAAAQSPFLTGAVAHKLSEDIGFQFLPGLNESEELTFEDRVTKGIKMALSNGMDGFFGLAGILVAMGEKIKQGSGGTKTFQLLSKPRLLLRFAKGRLISKLDGRPMLPKDLWSLRVIASMGTDSTIYKNRIKDLWGRTPLDVYGNSETAIIATQTWDYQSMVFFPNLNFLEFIPEEEHFKWQHDRNYRPKTILLNEIEAGKNYELVITNFHGGPLVRYRLGDMIRVNALKNEKLGISLPQIVFERRADDLIDLGFIRLTERIIWQALENTAIPYAGWTARKDIYNKMPVLHLYVELQDGYEVSEEDFAISIYQQIKKVEDGLYVYKEIDSLETLIDYKPIKVTILPHGVFSDYKLRKQLEGTSLAHLRPPHINPPDKILSQLLGTSKDSTVHKETMSPKKARIVIR